MAEKTERAGARLVPFRCGDSWQEAGYGPRMLPGKLPPATHVAPRLRAQDGNDACSVAEA